MKHIIERLRNRGKRNSLQPPTPQDKTETPIDDAKLQIAINLPTLRELLEQAGKSEGKAPPSPTERGFVFSDSALRLQTNIVGIPDNETEAIQEQFVTAIIERGVGEIRANQAQFTLSQATKLRRIDEQVIAQIAERTGIAHPEQLDLPLIVYLRDPITGHQGLGTRGGSHDVVTGVTAVYVADGLDENLIQHVHDGAHERRHSMAKHAVTFVFKDGQLVKRIARNGLETYVKDMITGEETVEGKGIENTLATMASADAYPFGKTNFPDQARQKELALLDPNIQEQVQNMFAPLLFGLSLDEGIVPFVVLTEVNPYFDSDMYFFVFGRALFRIIGEDLAAKNGQANLDPRAKVELARSLFEKHSIHGTEGWKTVLIDSFGEESARVLLQLGDRANQQDFSNAVTLVITELQRRDLT